MLSSSSAASQYPDLSFKNFRPGTFLRELQLELQAHIRKVVGLPEPPATAAATAASAKPATSTPPHPLSRRRSKSALSRDAKPRADASAAKSKVYQNLVYREPDARPAAASPPSTASDEWRIHAVMMGLEPVPVGTARTTAATASAAANPKKRPRVPQPGIDQKSIASQFKFGPLEPELEAVRVATAQRRARTAAATATATAAVATAELEPSAPYPPVSSVVAELERFRYHGPEFGLGGNAAAARSPRNMASFLLPAESRLAGFEQSPSHLPWASLSTADPSPDTPQRGPIRLRPETSELPSTPPAKARRVQLQFRQKTPTAIRRFGDGASVEADVETIVSPEFDTKPRAVNKQTEDPIAKSFRELKDQSPERMSLFPMKHSNSFSFHPNRK